MTLDEFLALAQDVARYRDQVTHTEGTWANPDLVARWHMACSPEVLAALVRVAMAARIEHIGKISDEYCAVCDAGRALDAALGGKS